MHPDHAAQRGAEPRGAVDLEVIQKPRRDLRVMFDRIFHLRVSRPTRPSAPDHVGTEHMEIPRQGSGGLIEIAPCAGQTVQH